MNKNNLFNKFLNITYRKLKKSTRIKIIIIKNSLLNIKSYPFIIHHVLIILFYGKVKKYCSFVISPQINEKLRTMINKNNYTEYRGGESLKLKNDELIINRSINKGDIDLYKFDESLKKDLHDEIRLNISKWVKSPFTFVNTRIWTTKASAKNFGSNDFHVDGFYPGFLKIMIYPKGINDNVGGLILNNNKFDNKKPGFCIGIRNSYDLHSGVPGKIYDKISVEVTIMRSLINSPQLIPCHPDGRHFKRVLQPYLKK